MPIIIDEDDQTVTYQKDDGSTIRVLKAAAEKAGVYRPGDASAPVYPENIMQGALEESPAELERAGMPSAASGDIGAAPSLPAEIPPPTLTQQRTEMQPAIAGGGSQSQSVSMSSTTPGQAEAVEQGPEAGQLPSDLSTREGMLQASEGVRSQAEAAIEQAAVESQGLAEKARLNDERNAAVETMEGEHRQKREAEQAERATLVANQDAEIQKYLNGKPDRDRFWNSRSTGQKVLAGIGMALGAVGQAGTGKRNDALDLILKAIDADVDMQFKEFEMQRKKVGMTGEQVDSFDKGFSQRELLRGQEVARGIAKTAREVEVIADKTSSEAVKAKAEGFLGQLQQKYGEKLHDWADGAQKFEEQKRATARGEAQRDYGLRTGRISANTARQSLSFKKSEAAAAKKAAEAESKLAGQLINPDGRTPEANLIIGKSRWAGDEKQMEKDSDALHSRMFMHKQSRELQHMIKKHGRLLKTGNTVLASTAKRKIDSLLWSLSYISVKAIDGNKISDADVQIFAKILGGGKGGGGRGLMERAEPSKIIAEVIRRSDAELRGWLQQRLVKDDGSVDVDAARGVITQLDELDEAEYSQRRKKDSAEVTFQGAVSPGGTKKGLEKKLDPAYQWANMLGKRGDYTPTKGQAQKAVKKLSADALRGDSGSRDLLMEMAQRDDILGEEARSALAK